MLQSLRVSESGLIGQQQKLEIIANNLANVDTPGFRRILSTFEAQAPPGTGPGGGRPVIGVQNAAGGPSPNLNQLLPGNLLRMNTAVDLRPGSMRATGNPLDLAIEGEGFFVVQTPQGEAYTRNGSFTLDPEGRLVTRDGLPVLGEGGPVEVPPGQLVEIASDGTVRAGASELGRLKLVQPASRADVVPAGSTLLVRAQGRPAPRTIAPERVRMQAGFLETSNTNPVSELVQMIRAQRIFEAGQRVLTSADETLRRAVTDLPKVNG